MRYTFTARTGETLRVSDNRTEDDARNDAPNIAKSWGAKLEDVVVDGKQAVLPNKRDMRKSY